MTLQNKAFLALLLSAAVVSAVRPEDEAQKESPKQLQLAAARLYITNKARELGNNRWFRHGIAPATAVAITYSLAYYFDLLPEVITPAAFKKYGNYFSQGASATVASVLAFIPGVRSNQTIQEANAATKQPEPRRITTEPDEATTIESNPEDQPPAQADNQEQSNNEPVIKGDADQEPQGELTVPAESAKKAATAFRDTGNSEDWPTYWARISAVANE